MPLIKLMTSYKHIYTLRKVHDIIGYRMKKNHINTHNHSTKHTHTHNALVNFSIGNTQCSLKMLTLYNYNLTIVHVDQLSQD